MSPVDDLLAWLAGGCRSAAGNDALMSALCARLVDCGVPLARGALFIRTLHPESMGQRVLWKAGEGTLVTDAPFEYLQDPGYTASPIVRVYETGTGLRRRLKDPDCPMDFAILQELKDQGLTDYVVAPILFGNGEIHVSTWCSAAPEGFSERAIELLASIQDPLARVAEVRSARRIAVNLLDTYVGGQAGGRILAGQIRRGDIETVRAAIWLSDMRDFTARADRMRPEDLIALLNRYFDCQVPVIRRHGGEVLKFMGDGLLAIFPVAATAAHAEVCRQALAAARAVEAGVAAADWGGLEAPGAVKFGVALHLGEVLYGNVGSSNRLDFTCIGPAVNLAARIEALSGEIGRTILASAAFAEACGGMVPLGSFALKGVAAEQALYGAGER